MNLIYKKPDENTNNLCEKIIYISLNYEDIKKAEKLIIQYLFYPDIEIERCCLTAISHLIRRGLLIDKNNLLYLFEVMPYSQELQGFISDVLDDFDIFSNHSD